MSDYTKQELISALNTFLATFIATIGISLSQGDIMWTGAFWGAIALVAIRAAVKAVIMRFVPVSLGGRKVES